MSRPPVKVNTTEGDQIAKAVVGILHGLGRTHAVHLRPDPPLPGVPPLTAHEVAYYYGACYGCRRVVLLDAGCDYCAAARVEVA